MYCYLAIDQRCVWVGGVGWGVLVGGGGLQRPATQICTQATISWVLAIWNVANAHDANYVFRMVTLG